MEVQAMGFWFRCSHKNTTFPITRRRKVKEAGRVADTYIVCLDCGYEMPYSWNEMRVLKERRRARVNHQEQPEEAIAV
ncbi:MAG: hypothetical protein HY316_07055 [Acidobacteria bacterium]|nr:hypothetical protein [Acidobacteriota bacterium]